jgi:mycothiol synthase
MTRRKAVSIAVSAVGETVSGDNVTGNWTIRGYNEGDIPRLVELINAANVADGLDKQTDVEDLTRDFAMPLSDPPTQVIIAEGAEGSFAGYGRILSVDDPAAGERLYQFGLKVHPDARGNGLEDALAARLMAMARTHNDDPARERFEKVSVLSGTRIENEAMRKLLERVGLRDVRHGWVMERSLAEAIDEPRTIEGVTLREYRRPDDNLASHEAYSNSFIDHFEYHALPQEFWDYQMGQPSMRPDLSLLAEPEGEPGHIVGFCICSIKESENERIGREEGWIDLLGTVRGWRGRGLGRSLLLRGLHALKAAGMETALLGVDSESPTGANRLYESVGFTVRHHDVMYKCALSEITIKFQAL